MDVLDLFHRYRDSVYRLALSYTRSPQEAEDVSQTVFLRLLENPRITPGKEKAWLATVTANECRSLLRSAWWRRTQPLDEELPAPEGSGDILREVMALAPKYRVVIYLHYYEGYTAREIGQILKIPASTVTTRLARGREKLRQALEED